MALRQHLDCLLVLLGIILVTDYHLDKVRKNWLFLIKHAVLVDMRC